MKKPRPHIRQVLLTDVDLTVKAWGGIDLDQMNFTLITDPAQKGAALVGSMYFCCYTQH
jgi:hypothetical protein